MPKVFYCSACGGQHKRPVGVKCQFQNTESTESTSVSTNGTQNVNENTNAEILNALTAVCYILKAIEQRIDRSEKQLQSRPKVADDAFGVVDVITSSSQETV